ncbi:MAG: hypothetical protein Q8N99_02960 [Nanoarchaeota archaeon]|nr:hypothetical protein [Nanoarchaeota archaeon]
MVTQASGWLFLRDSYLVPFCEYPPFPDNHPCRGERPKLSDKDKSRLRKIIEEVNQLRDKLSDCFHDPDTIIGPNVHLSGGVERILERSTNPIRSGELFEEIHGILKKYPIRPEVYLPFGRAFEELGLQPSEDTCRAINYFRQIKDEETHVCPNEYFPLRVICWDVDDPEKNKS